MSARGLLTGSLLLSAVLGAAWWFGGARVETPGRDAAAPRAAAEPGRMHAATREPQASRWGPSPFGSGPAVVGPERDAEPALSPFRARVRHFFELRSRLDSLPTPSAELLAQARALRGEVTQRLRTRELTPGEALLLTGALLEVLEPDAQLRAAELAQFGARHLPRPPRDG